MAGPLWAALAAAVVRKTPPRMPPLPLPLPVPPPLIPLPGIEAQGRCLWPGLRAFPRTMMHTESDKSADGSTDGQDSELEKHHRLCRVQQHVEA